jgi:hypothetical protein
MAFQEPSVQPDFGRLLFILNQSRMQVENPALYQCIKQFIEQTKQMQGLFSSNITDITGSTSANTGYPIELGHSSL